jgi:putative oxidoreductase
LHFIPGTLPSGVAGQFLSALTQSHYDLVVSAVELSGGLLLLVNLYVPLALVLLMDRSGLIFAIVVMILWGVVAIRHRQYFSGIFVQRAS